MFKKWMQIKLKISLITLKVEYLTNSLNKINREYREMANAISPYENKMQLIVEE